MIDKFIEYMKDESMSENTYLSYARDVNFLKNIIMILMEKKCKILLIPIYLCIKVFY